MLTILKSSNGCTLRDLVYTLPKRYQSLDMFPEYLVLDSVQILVRWGLAEVFVGDKLMAPDEMQKFDRWNWPHDISVYVSKATLEMEETLGVTFEAFHTRIFGEPAEHSLAAIYLYGRKYIFVLMPFAEDLKPVYDDHIRAVTSRLDLPVARADDFFTNGSIMADIWSGINQATIVIADCTRRNPNVFYEIGLAHAIGKSTILITQSLDDVPFDLRHLRVIVYEFSPRGMKKFEEALENTIKTLMSSLPPNAVSTRS